MDAAIQEEIYLLAIEIAKKAGVMISEAFHRPKNVEVKSGPNDLVTETDKAVEKMVFSAIHDKFPTHKTIGEETVADGVKAEFTDDITWIIDPIDGTMNFVHSFPHTCISIGVWFNKEAEVGVVYNPILEQMFYAKKGQGAFLNDKQIKVSGQTDLSRALVMQELWWRPEEDKMKVYLDNFLTIGKLVQGPRSLGSAALNMCHVAMGGADAYFEMGMHCWDVAAGALIVTEAGGVVGDLSGGPLDIMNRRVICASSEALSKLIVEKTAVVELERD